MITLFKAIRKQLSSSKENNKFRQYLVYALGEILLVMVGILLALEVNNWNEKNKKMTYEKGQLADLETEMIAMKSFLELQIGYFELAKESNRALLQVMESEKHRPITPDSIDALMMGTLNTDFVTSERLSLETKVDFKLLPEKKYRQLEKVLQDWRHFAERIGADFQHIEDNREKDLLGTLMGIGVPGWQVLYNNHRPKNFPIDYQAMLKNHEVYALMYYRFQRIEGIIRDMKGGIDDLDTMLSKIE